MIIIPVSVKALVGTRVHVDNKNDPTLHKKKLYEAGTVFHVEAIIDKNGKATVNYNILLDRRTVKGKRGIFINLNEEYFTVIEPNREP